MASPSADCISLFVALVFRIGGSVHHNFLNFCNYLLSGAKVNAGRGSDSPLHAAARQDCAEQVSLLLEFGADVNLRDENNRRASELAPPGGSIQQLLKTFQGKVLQSCCCLCHGKNNKRSKRKLFSMPRFS